MAKAIALDERSLTYLSIHRPRIKHLQHRKSATQNNQMIGPVVQGIAPIHGAVMKRYCEVFDFYNPVK